MEKNILGLPFVLILLLIVQFAEAQGCSDSGFCTIDGFKPENSHAIFSVDFLNQKPIYVPKNQIKIGFSVGKSDYSISVFGNYVEYGRQINEKFGINAKISLLSQHGDGVSTLGLSDVFFSGYYDVFSKAKAILGIKFPFSDGNQKRNNLSLPMDYQTSLGTIDLILGLNYQLKNWQLALAFQQPISQNKNQFLAENDLTNSPFKEFQSTNQFKRSGDVLLRVSYPVEIRDRFQITPSILPIYHLVNDQYTDAFGKQMEIEGSKGLTLNVNMYFDYHINTTNGVQFSFAFPLKARKVRPDGLTRSFVVNLEYKFRF